MDHPTIAVPAILRSLGPEIQPIIVILTAAFGKPGVFDAKLIKVDTLKTKLTGIFVG